MIDLYNVKLNGEYDFIQASAPTTSGTWLCTQTSTAYVKGATYKVTAGTPATITRIDAGKDVKILSAIYPTIQEVCQYLNNFFYVNRQANDSFIDQSLYTDLTHREYKQLCTYVSALGNYIFATKTISNVQQDVFNENDLVQIKCSVRNNYITSITNVTGSMITVDNENFVETVEDAFIILMDIPSAVQKAICAMVYYDVFQREKPNTLQSENIGNYSYSKATVQVGGLYYPPELTSVLEQYKKVRFV